jgi:hypothetical protein
MLIFLYYFIFIFYTNIMSDTTNDVLGKIVEDIILDHIENNSSENVEEKQIIENVTEKVEKVEEIITKPELTTALIEELRKQPLTIDIPENIENNEILSLDFPSSLEIIETEKPKETIVKVAEVINEEIFSICCFSITKKQPI